MNLYWWLVLANLGEYLSPILILSFCICIILIFVAVSDDMNENENKLAQRAVVALVLVVILGLLACLIPSRKDLAIMYGWDAINSDTVKDVVENLTKRIT